MAECKLFQETVFGPLSSRRLGSSLGINLLPNDVKVCNFNCIYCECGWTDLKSISRAKFPSREKVYKELKEALIELKLTDQLPDSITFAGNGEPTLHPRFTEIMDDVVKLRNEFSPGSNVTVFSNCTLLNKREIVSALKKADQRIMKFDAGTEEDYIAIDRPLARRSLSWIKNHLAYFDSKLSIQSLFLQGSFEGRYIDNTKPSSLEPWLQCIEDIKPGLVMIYSIDRPTAAPGLQKVNRDVLCEIAEKVENLGIKTQVN